MNNEPVAWMDEINTFVLDEDYKQFPKSLQNGMIPLYTHPVKAQKCVVKDCENHKHQGGFTGDLCNPCYEFITTGKGVYSQAYRNTQTKPLLVKVVQDHIEDLVRCVKLFRSYGMDNTADEMEVAIKELEEAVDAPQTKPLSDAELDIEIVKFAQGKHDTMRDMLRAIEAKVRGEK